MNNDQRRDAINNAIKSARDSMNEARKLKKDCPHNIVAETNAYARCDICNGLFGWTCEKSPDSICHYSSECENGKIELINKELVDFPDDYEIKINDGNHNEICIYCGEMCHM